MFKLFVLAAITFVALGMDGLGRSNFICEDKLVSTKCNCKMWGDPHYTTFKCAEHDIMGGYLAGKPDYYNVARCEGVTVDDLPIQIIGSNFPWPNDRSDATGEDYTVLELYNGDTDFYFFFSTQGIASWGESADILNDPQISLDYDKSKSKLKSFTSPDKANNKGTVTLGLRYRITVERKSFEQAELTIVIDNDHTITITARAEQQKRSNGRKAMNAWEITMAQAYECMVCGVCGDYKDLGDKTLNEGCKANQQWRAMKGWTGAKREYALEPNAKGFEVGAYKDNCAWDDDDTPARDNPKNNKCEGNVKQDIEKKCRKARERFDQNGCCKLVKGKNGDKPDLCGLEVQDCVDDVCEAYEELGGAALGDILKTEVGDLVKNLGDECEVAKKGEDEPCDEDKKKNGGRNKKNGNKNKRSRAQAAVENELWEPEQEYGFEEKYGQPEEFGDYGAPEESGYVLELTKQDLIILALVLANLVIVAATTCMCLNKKKNEYAAVKAVYTSDEEAANQLVE